MSLISYEARLAEHNQLVKNILWLRFELINPNHLDFIAGQYVMLRIPGTERTRNYSIASAPIIGHEIDLLVDVKPRGDGTKYLQSLRPGDSVQFMAPAGQFVVAQDLDEKELIFVATGSGISAIRSMILDLLQTKHDPRSIRLHWGLRFIDDVYWEEDFRLLTKEYENFTFDLVLSKGPENWPLCTGRVNECLKGHYQNFAGAGYYLCGSQTMIQGVKELLDQKGVDKLNVHFEKFY